MSILKSYTVIEEIRYINTLFARKALENSVFKQGENLTGANMFIVKYLVENTDRKIYQKDIENKFGITRSTASKVLKLMEEKDLIVRQGCEHDARLKSLTPTPKAYDLHEKLKNSLKEGEKDLLSNFTKEEIATLKTLLNKIKNNLKQSQKKESNIKND